MFSGIRYESNASLYSYHKVKVEFQIEHKFMTSIALSLVGWHKMNAMEESKAHPLPHVTKIVHNF